MSERPRQGRRRRLWAAIALAATALALSALGWLLLDPYYRRLVLESPRSGRCEKRLTRSDLEQSLALASRFLLAHQRPNGNFDYEYDWERRAFSEDDNEVRQAGALWGLTLIHQVMPSPELRSGIERGLAFFHEHSRAVKGRRCVAYPKTQRGGTGTVALIALAHIDFLRSNAAEAGSPRLAELRQDLGQYLAQLEAALRPDGSWFGEYDTKSCKPRGEHSAYADGEALLALVKAYKYLGYRELEATLSRAAAAGTRLNIDQALADDSDSDLTKAYYQWSSMAFYELATSQLPNGARYGDQVLRLADWMIDVHGTLFRQRNTGYAYEGLIHAYALAKQRGDAARQAKLGCVIDVGMSRLLSWQVGGPLASAYANRGARDGLALGGVLNAADEAALRIDVTQHQAHATLLALRYVYPR